MNILVRANQNARGPARNLLIDLVAGQHVLVTSAEILIELGRVLRYPRIQALFGLKEEDIYEYLGFLKDCSEVVITNPNVTFPIRDPPDIPILSTAFSGEADLLCTLDTDFFTPGGTIRNR